MFSLVLLQSGRLDSFQACGWCSCDMAQTEGTPPWKPILLLQWQVSRVVVRSARLVYINASMHDYGWGHGLHWMWLQLAAGCHIG
jgi:hypothetical protein